MWPTHRLCCWLCWVVALVAIACSAAGAGPSSAETTAPSQSAATLPRFLFGGRVLLAEAVWWQAQRSVYLLSINPAWHHRGTRYHSPGQLVLSMPAGNPLLQDCACGQRPCTPDAFWKRLTTPFALWGNELFLPDLDRAGVPYRVTCEERDPMEGAFPPQPDRPDVFADPVLTRCQVNASAADVELALRGREELVLRMRAHDSCGEVAFEDVAVALVSSSAGPLIGASRGPVLPLAAARDRKTAGDAAPTLSVVIKSVGSHLAVPAVREVVAHALAIGARHVYFCAEFNRHTVHGRALEARWMEVLGDYHARGQLSLLATANPPAPLVAERAAELRAFEKDAHKSFGMLVALLHAKVHGDQLQAWLDADELLVAEPPWPDGVPVEADSRRAPSLSFAAALAAAVRGRFGHEWNTLCFVVLCPRQAHSISSGERSAALNLRAPLRERFPLVETRPAPNRLNISRVAIGTVCERDMTNFWHKSVVVVKNAWSAQLHRPDLCMPPEAAEDGSGLPVDGRPGPFLAGGHNCFNQTCGPSLPQRSGVYVVHFNALYQRRWGTPPFANNPVPYEDVSAAARSAPQQFVLDQRFDDRDERG